MTYAEKQQANRQYDDWWALYCLIKTTPKSRLQVMIKSAVSQKGIAQLWGLHFEQNNP